MIDPARPSAPRPRASVSALPGYVAGRRATSAETAPLASNESHEPPLPGVLEAIAEHAGRVTRYPDMAAVRLREALAGRVGLGVDAVAVGAGSVSVLQQVLTAFCEAGDDVVFASGGGFVYRLAQQDGALRWKLRIDRDAEFMATTAVDGDDVYASHLTVHSGDRPDAVVRIGPAD